MRNLTIILLVTAGMGTLYTYGLLPFSKQKPTHLSELHPTVDIERLENSLFHLESKTDISHFLDHHGLLAHDFFGIRSEKNKSDMIDKLYNMVHNEHLKALHQEVVHQYTQIDTLRDQLTHAFMYLKQAYPSFEIPKIATIITGMGTDLHVSKSFIVIGLDYFLGEGAKIRPIHLPDYLLRTYQPSYIAPKIILRLSNYFNAADSQDKTLLQDLIYAGKAYYFTKSLLPHVPEMILLGYTPAQFKEVEKYQRIIWKHFIDQALFYENNHFIKKRYISERPFTSEIGPGCPGNIGSWLGFQIVKKYMKKNPQITLSVLMNQIDAQQIFKESKYRP